MMMISTLLDVNANKIWNSKGMPQCSCFLRPVLIEWRVKCTFRSKLLIRYFFGFSGQVYWERHHKSLIPICPWYRIKIRKKKKQVFFIPIEPISWSHHRFSAGGPDHFINDASSINDNNKKEFKLWVEPGNCWSNKINCRRYSAFHFKQDFVWIRKLFRFEPYIKTQSLFSFAICRICTTIHGMLKCAGILKTCKPSPPLSSTSFIYKRP